jgi:hypothetical protein
LAIECAGRQAFPVARHGVGSLRSETRKRGHVAKWNSSK